MIVYRIQPRNADLHGVETETSNGEFAGGVHVFETTKEIVAALGDWAPSTEAIELAVVECEGRDVRENGDYEGSLLLKGRGQIVERKPFDGLREIRRWADEQSG